MKNQKTTTAPRVSTGSDWLKAHRKFGEKCLRAASATFGGKAILASEIELAEAKRNGVSAEIEKAERALEGIRGYYSREADALDQARKCLEGVEAEEEANRRAAQAYEAECKRALASGASIRDRVDAASQTTPHRQAAVRSGKRPINGWELLGC
ncbi:MAG TPA: hypothetical protein VJB99_04265, partial [Patescibacteria group bacterium]|nr:hypothetical protein [Patescibacteria group bacterium]